MTPAAQFRRFIGINYSMFQRDEETWKHYPVNHKADYSRADGMVGFAWVARYTLEFLDAYLKQDAMAMQFLKKPAAENGAPPHLLTVDFRAAKGAPATFEALRISAGEKGFDHLTENYEVMKKENPDFKLDEAAMTHWASELKDSSHMAQAIDVLKLEIQTYPEAGDAYAGLADAYQKTGEKQLAIENYKKAIEKNPNDSDAKEKLTAIEAAPAAK